MKNETYPEAEEKRSKFHDLRKTPLGYSYLTDNPVSIFPYTGKDQNGKKGYEYKALILPCENGSQVLEHYNSSKSEPYQLCLFYEKPVQGRSNFAGDFYAVKMGDYFVTLFKNFPQALPSKILGKFFKDIKSVDDEAAYLAQLAYTYEGDKINANLVRDALFREYQFRSRENSFGEILGNIASIPADAIGWCADKLEKIKPDEKNYNPKSADYTPLIPLPFLTRKVSSFMDSVAESPFAQDVESVFAKVWNLVEQSASKVKDAAVAHLPEAFKKMIGKILEIISSIKNFLNKVENVVADFVKYGIESLELLNAFSCGIVSGVIGLLQCILYILEFLLQPTITFSYQQSLERRNTLEKAEDIVDWMGDNAPKFFDAVSSLLDGERQGSSTNLEDLADKAMAFLGNFSRYTVAYYLGIAVFEVVSNILLLIFTEGAGNVVKGATYVEKAASLLKVVAREGISVATIGLTDLLAFLTKFLARFTKACAKGFKGFIKFVEELLQGTKNGAKAEELAEEANRIEDVVLKAQKPLSIYKIPTYAIRGLQSVGIEIIGRAKDYLLRWRNKKIFIGDWEEVTNFWRRILKPKLGAGTGGVLKYLEVLSRNMVAQEHNMSCAAACIRQLAKDHGIEMTESAIRKLAGTTEEMGTYEKGMSDAAREIFKNTEFSEGTIDHIPVQTSELIGILGKNNPWIAWIRESPNVGNHAIIIDKFENGLVYIRDPWPIEGINRGKGVEATIKLEDFETAWSRTGKYAFWFKN